ncbi:calcium-binding protein 4-like [Lingula anatina]|uniref:Calcium-binding protein 4-like n=1 Tax=Lingula anatina TaxID=7574 RepID=A0A1S3H3L2_LINAN|nr:calcium-binding protein 4-like [Lingula anatina]|eukprot:XP_013380547.1 calcium-binding protein 4-like [Lingula anatina]
MRCRCDKKRAADYTSPLVTRANTKAAFSDIDKDRDNHVSKAEFTEATMTLSRTRSSVAEFDIMDVNNDDRIDPGEFDAELKKPAMCSCDKKRAVDYTSPLVTRANTKAAFSDIDKDRDNHVSKAEFKEAAMALSTKRSSVAEFDIMDVNNDDRIDPGEFDAELKK